MSLLNKSSQGNTNMLIVKASMEKTHEDLDRINKYLTNYDSQKGKSTFQNNTLPLKKTTFCSMRADDIEEHMKITRKMIDKRKERIYKTF